MEKENVYFYIYALKRGFLVILYIKIKSHVISLSPFPSLFRPMAKFWIWHSDWTDFTLSQPLLFLFQVPTKYRATLPFSLSLSLPTTLPIYQIITCDNYYFFIIYLENALFDKIHYLKFLKKIKKEKWIPKKKKNYKHKLEYIH